MRGLLRSFGIQCRVLGALIMRETYSRFGRENLGFAWIFAEFLVFALPVIVMWSFIRGRYEHRLLVVPFVWSGYMPIMLFRHIGGRMLGAVRLNMSLFYHRNVTPFDAVLSRMGLEVIGNYGAAAFSFVLLYSYRPGRLAARHAAVVSRLFLYDLVVCFGRAWSSPRSASARSCSRRFGRRCRTCICRFGVHVYG